MGAGEDVLRFLLSSLFANRHLLISHNLLLGLFLLCYGVLDYQDLGDCALPGFSIDKNRITSGPSIQIEMRIDHGGGTGSPNQPVDCSTREAMNVLTAIFGEFTSSVSTMAHTVECRLLDRRSHNSV